MTSRSRITGMRHAAGDHVVTSVETPIDDAHHRRQPCGGCPWRVDQTGQFPPEAFRLSARTAYDMADYMFGCHESGSERPSTCAGFLLVGAEHNMAYRMAVAEGRIRPGELDDGGHELHRSYRAMAVANGVPADDPVLGPCRGSDD